MKKSQISLFIILGIFLLIVFSLIMFVQSNETTENGDQQIQDNMPSSSSFENQFAKCVQDKTELGFDILLKQGGIIYEDQGGIFPRPDMVQNV